MIDPSQGVDRIADVGFAGVRRGAWRRACGRHRRGARIDRPHRNAQERKPIGRYFPEVAMLLRAATKRTAAYSSKVRLRPPRCAGRSRRLSSAPPRRSGRASPPAPPRQRSDGFARPPRSQAPSGVSPRQRRSGAVDQERPQVHVVALGISAEPGLAAGGGLPRDPPEPRPSAIRAFYAILRNPSPSNTPS